MDAPMKQVFHHTPRAVIAIAVFLTFLSCKDVGERSVDLTGLRSCEQRMSIEELFDSMAFVSLHTNGQCLLGSPRVFLLDESDILVVDGKEIYRFDRKGEFLNRIGMVGNGRGEHGKISSISFSRKRNMVFVGTFSGEVLKYGIDGDYIGKFDLAENEGMITTARWNDAVDLFVYQTRIYGEDGIEVFLKARDVDGRFRMKEKIYGDSEHVNTNLFNYGNLRDCEDGFLCLLPFDDRVFHVGKHGVDVLCTLDRGTHSPNRQLCEDVAQSDLLYQTKYLMENIVLTPKHFFLSIEGKDGARDLIVDRNTGRLVHNQPNGEAGEGHLRLSHSAEYGFWPWGSTGNAVYETVTLYDLDKASADYIKGKIENQTETDDFTSVVVVGYE